MVDIAKAHAAEWERQIISAGADKNVAQVAVALAGLNGLFDPHRELQSALDRLEVSEAVGLVKSQLIADLTVLLNDEDCTPGQRVMNALTAIKLKTGAPKSDVPPTDVRTIVT